MAAREDRLEQPPPDRRRDAGADQARPRLRGQPVGRRRRAAPARTARSTRTAASSSACGTQDIGTGTRTLVAMITAETLGLPRRRGQGGDRRQQLPVQRRQRRQHDGGVRLARHPRDAPARRSTRSFATVAPALGVEPAALVAAGGRVRSKGDPAKGLAVEGRVQAAGHRAGGASTASGSRGCRRAARAACSSPTSRSTSRPASPGSRRSSACRTAASSSTR